MNMNMLLTRIVNLITKPKDEWKNINGEQVTIKTLFIPLVFILSAIPAICSFLGWLFLVGFHFVGRFLLITVYEFILIPAMIFGFGYIINEIIAQMGGKKNLIAAMKLSVYTFVPFCLAGILFFVPARDNSMWVFVLILSLYGLFIFYWGVKEIFEVQQDKQIPIVAIAGIIFVLFMVIYRFSPRWFF